MTFTHRKIKSKKYKGFNITFCEMMINGEKKQVSALYMSPRHKETVFEAKADDENIAFEKIKKVIDSKEKGSIPKFKPYCWDCKKTLTEENLFPYSYTLHIGKKKFFCKECTRMDMMIPKKDFLKEIKWNEKNSDHRAVIENDKIVWKKIR
tara:strand:- start:224 stop:676 length:453 start_codon:yes stop_codon:yes gene_type:complete